MGKKGKTGKRKNEPLKSEISNVIVQTQREFFSNTAVAKIMDIEEDTLNKRIKRGSIPVGDFEKFIVAWKKICEEPGEISSEDLNGLQKTVERVERLLSLYKAFADIGTVPDLDNEYLLDGKSARFPYLIYRCFNAFTTLTPYDVSFLRQIFWGDQRNREAVLQEMATAKMSTPQQIISMLTCGEGKSWLRACELYSSEINVEGSVQTHWRDCAERIKKWRKDKPSQPAWQTGRVEQNNCLAAFLVLIWPKDDADDTEFGAEEIKAIITFKYFLTEEARQELIAKFQKRQPKE